MKILFVNKYLYRKGGSEAYMLDLANYLHIKGHEVEYFGMMDQRNIVKNTLNVYIDNIDYNEMSTIRKITSTFKTIYSIEAKKKIEVILDKFKPDIVHINNYNFQITPSILKPISKRGIPIIQTIHDPQNICPNHRLYIESKKMICNNCQRGNYVNAFKNKCVDNSMTKSALAAIESYIYHFTKTYEKHYTRIISPSNFLKMKHKEFGFKNVPIDVLHNFITTEVIISEVYYDDYVFYFGRISVEKGIETLARVCRNNSDINFKIAGIGELSDTLSGIENVELVGYKSGQELIDLIKKAKISVYPSEWYENCPMSILESQMYGTPVIASDLGGSSELINDGVDGFIFHAGDCDDMTEKIRTLYFNHDLIDEFSKKCNNKIQRFGIENYYNKLMQIYNKSIEMKKV